MLCYSSVRTMRSCRDTSEAELGAMYLGTSRKCSELLRLILGRRFLIISSGATHFSGETMRTSTGSTITSQINLFHEVHLRLTTASALRANIRAVVENSPL